MTIVALVKAWNEEHNLQQSLPTIRPHVNAIIILDGRYRHFPCREDYPHSIDDSARIAHANGATWIQAQRPWDTEIEARSRLLEHGLHAAHRINPEAPAWGLIIDADELIEEWDPEGVRSLLGGPRIAYHVRFLDRGEHARDLIRLIPLEPGLRYAQNHWSIQRPDGSMLHTDASYTRAITLRHLPRHDPERARDADAYYAIKPTLDP